MSRGRRLRHRHHRQQLRSPVPHAAAKPRPPHQQARIRVDYAAAPAAATTASNSAAQSPVPRLSRGPNY